MTPELEVYVLHTQWLLSEVLGNLDSADTSVLVARPGLALEANNLLAVGKHLAGVTRAYVLGFGCGMDVQRDRSTEFDATAAEATTVLTDLRSLTIEIPAAFETLGPEMLDRRFLPSRALYGTGEPKEMSGREAIVHNIRHLGIHLGEIRLTRSLLDGG